MSTTITELDYALNCASVEIDTTNARAELAALRTSADAERHWQQAAEQERRNAAEQRERAEGLRLQVEDQARQLSEARKVLHDVDEPEYTLSSALRELRNVISPNEVTWLEWLSHQAAAIDAWLSANAPAPQAEQP